MAKQVSISDDDINAMEKDLKAGSLPKEQANFLEYLLKRAKAGKQGAPLPTSNGRGPTTSDLGLALAGVHPPAGPDLGFRVLQVSQVGPA